MTQPMHRREFLKRSTAAGVLATAGLPAAALAAPAAAAVDEPPLPGDDRSTFRCWR